MRWFIGLVMVVGVSVVGCENPAARAGSGGERSEESAEKESSEREVSVSPLEKHAWESRPVIVFAPSADDEAYERQARMFEEHEAGLVERDIVVYRVFEESARGPEGALSEEEAAALRGRFEPESEFVVVLVGKDTTEKLRMGEVMGVETLFDTIDAMPMRQREMGESR